MGERLLTADDMEKLAVGATILGTGGGGDPYIGKLMAIQAIEEYGPVRLIDVDDVPDDELVIPTAMMGAPTVMLEKIPSGAELVQAFRAIESFMGRKAAATTSAEAGGLNSTVPVSAAAKLGLPLVDADGMGRAFPEIQMASFSVLGVPATPMVLTDEKGNLVLLQTVNNKWTENLARSATITMGCSAMITLYPMTGAQMKSVAIKGTLSYAMRLGEAVLEARAKKEDPIARILEITKGYQLFRGKIVDVMRRTTAGFARGTVKLEGIDDYRGRSMDVEFQNENLVAIEDGQVRASVPDLITLLEVETGQAITTEGLKYGYRTTVIGMPCAPVWRTPEGIKVVGPRYFGYDVDYVPIEDRVGPIEDRVGPIEERMGRTMKYRLGIDVGGTNTDAVILDLDDKPVAKIKTPTTEDVTTGIVKALDAVLGSSGISPTEISHAMLGTTHCTNAIVERTRLSPIGIIRLGAPATLAIKPLTAWPADLKEQLGKYSYVVNGGHEYDGQEIVPMNEGAIREIAQELKGKVTAIAVSGVFSPVNSDHEKRASEILRDVLGEDFSVSLSYEIGALGILERENATILNAAVVEVAKKAAGAFQSALESRGVKAMLYFTQNDGTLMALEYAMRYPIRTIASGPANSIRGAAYLSGLADAMVVDVGGTTSDIGILAKGFPRQSAVAVEIGGVRTNFRMPDLTSLGLGGGSLVKRGAGGMTVGPQSVGFRLTEKALVFGGDTFTMTDVAVARGMASLGDAAGLKSVSSADVEEAFALSIQMVEETIDRMKTSAEAVPLVAVGGGSILLPKSVRGASEVIHPEHFEVANAIGAAIAQVSGELDRVYRLEGRKREDVLEEAKEATRQEAVKAGAEPGSIEIIELDEIPLAYLPSNAVRLRCKAAGALAG